MALTGTAIALSAASIGLAGAQAAGAFDKDEPELEAGGDIAKARQDQRRRAAIAEGRSSTIMGGSSGSSGSSGSLGSTSLLGG